jgi:DNA primase
MNEQGKPGARDFYTEVVLPALAERLDSAFPEFGWRRDARGWVATNEETTHRTLGVRANRVVAHGPAPRGFLVHGAEATLWTTYVSGGTAPRGAEFVRTVEDIARRAGVDPSPIERPVRRDRRTELLHNFFSLCRKELASEGGARAREYLMRRGLPADTVEHSGLGVIPDTARSRHALRTAGYSELEIARSNVLADSRWPGRFCGAWRDETGRVKTLWARAVGNDASRDSRYLYLRGASRADLPPYGLSHVLKQPQSARRELVLVEGLLDVHQLRSRRVDNVAALGGTAVRAEMFERLGQLGFEQVTLCFDRDKPGRTATARAVEQAGRARRSPAVFVVDPDTLEPAKDPDELIRDRGITAWSSVLQTGHCGIAWRAMQLLEDVTPGSGDEARRDALSRAGSWLGTLPPRLALEQEDAVRGIAKQTGYSVDAVERAFRARYWQHALESSRHLARDPGRANSVTTEL